jgi:hypothetical protein
VPRRNVNAIRRGGLPPRPHERYFVYRPSPNLLAVEAILKAIEKVNSPRVRTEGCSKTACTGGQRVNATAA